jgi:hypothetical protein
MNYSTRQTPSQHDGPAAGTIRMTLAAVSTKEGNNQRGREGEMGGKNRWVSGIIII